MDTSKIIRGIVNGRNYTVTAPIVKEDYGLYLQIEGVELPETYQVDFSNSESSGTSVTMIGNADGVLIPRQFIDSGKDVFAFLYHVGEDFGRTVYKFRIPNKVRPDRTNEQPTPEEQSTIDQAINALNEAVAQTAQDKADADASAQNASADADRAERARDDARGYADTAYDNAVASANSAGMSQTYANDASASALASSQSAQSAEQSAQTASAKADAITGLTATATTLPSRESATVSYNAETGVMSFGIPRGKDGVNGDDGYSPTASVDKRGLTTTITITDKNGTTSAMVMDGAPGVDGRDGYSPTAKVSKAGKVATITITDEDGTTTASVSDGTDGTDGVSPTVTITPITGGHRVTITDADGEHSADVMDGTGNVDDVQINGTSIVSDGVANVPIASTNGAGVAKVQAFYGVRIYNNDILAIECAKDAIIKSGWGSWNPITPAYQDKSVFYGLAKSAGDTTQSQSSNAVGNYTEDAKSAISEMLNGSVAVSGTTPTIVAKSGIRYVCGEVATLDFTPSASGICDVVFTSGSTPTVVTLPSTVKFPDGAFTAEADTTYEINILDGIYGAVMAWT